MIISHLIIMFDQVREQVQVRNQVTEVEFGFLSSAKARRTTGSETETDCD